LSRNREVQKEILPIPDQPYTDQIAYDAKDPDASFPPIEPLRPPAGAPNVLVILLDDVGFGGWSLYARDGRPKYCYNFSGLRKFYVEGDAAMPAGEHQVRMEFAYDGGGLAKGGQVTLYLDGEKAGEGRVEATVLMVFSANETCDVGSESGTPVGGDYGARGNEFSRRIDWVQIDLGGDAEDADHLISPSERLQVAMARQ
jgi:hypothetical protein